jgi:predicted O-linked N-acetylglucosamine transferase (SPINDLY family)
MNVDISSEFQKAQQYEQQGNLAQAKVAYESVLRQSPHHELSMYGLALIYAQGGDIKSAKSLFEKITSVNPKNFGAYSNLGNCYTELSDLEKAKTCFEQAIEINPQTVDGHFNLGNTYSRMNRHADAIACYLNAEKIVPNLPNVNFNLANAYGLLGRNLDALEIYKKIEPIYKNNPHYCLYLGCVYFQLRNFPQAKEWFLSAIRIKDNFPDAYNELARLYTLAGKHREAVEIYLKAFEQEPSSQIYLENLVKGYIRVGKFYNAYDFAKKLKTPSTRNLALQYLSSVLCEWDDYEELRNFILQGGSDEVQGWDILRITDSPEAQYKLMRAFIQKSSPPVLSLGPVATPLPAKKIKIGYFSPDFRSHAVMHLSADIFKMHNREAFEVYAFSMSPELTERDRSNLSHLFDHYFEINELSDLEVAQKARELGIDLAVDLTGNTCDSRTGIFAHRVAPVQINYLGYTGTMAAEYYDYIIADRIVIPAEQRPFYSEKVAYMKSFMPRQMNLLPSPKPVTRTQNHLPPEGFVFCCFNKGFKFNPEVFSSWMRILKAVPLSVLWFNNLPPETILNLKKEATKQGVDAERLRFATYCENMEAHLGRQKLAGLFLDTFPYNAHTTASDALWSGLPVVTRVGNSFAGRVAASLLTAVGLPELITHTIEEYESLVIGLANNPERLSALRRKLKDNIKTHRVFDMKKFMSEYEAILTQMYQYAVAGQAAQIIDVENLSS